MTTSRSRRWLLPGLFCLSLLTPTAAFAQGRAASPGAWETYFSESESIQKLLYVPRDRAEGELYFRCRPGEGWIFLIEIAVPQLDGSMRITIGRTTLTPLAQVESEEMGGYTEAAIPADHPSMLSLARQSGIAVNGVRYPISIADRSVISRFIGACNRPG